HEIAEARVAGQLVEALETLPIGLLAHQPILALHRPIPSTLTHVDAPFALDRQIPDPVIDRAAREREPLGELVDRELVLRAHRARLLADVRGVCHAEDMFAPAR